MFKFPENDRITRNHPLATRPNSGEDGMFIFDGPCGAELVCLAASGKNWEANGLPGAAWEHVSVVCRRANRPANQLEVQAVIDRFWTPEDMVMQFHWPLAEGQHLDPLVVHLWAPIGFDVPCPPAPSLKERRTDPILSTENGDVMVKR